jgi:hypothetical protein
VAVFVNSFFEKRVEQILELASLVDNALSAAGIDYRIVGGLATYLYVEQAAPDAGRLTRDIDIAVRRQDLDRIAQAVQPFGLEYHHAAGQDTLIRAGEPARRAVHMVFSGEKVGPHYPEPVPELGASHDIQGIRLIALLALVRMKLTSFRLKDQTHLKDLDEAGLITPDVEAALSPVLLERLLHVRACD